MTSRFRSLLGLLVALGAVVLWSGSILYSSMLFTNGGSRALFMSEAVHNLSSLKAGSSGRTLGIRASNELYGEVSDKSRALYGFELVAEPFRETIFEVVERDTGKKEIFGSDFFWAFRRRSNQQEDLFTAWGRRVVWTLNYPGEDFVVTLQKWYHDEVQEMIEADIACRYVRREIRELADTDLDAFLSAMQFFFGLRMNDIPNSMTTYDKVTALHNANAYCYHDGLQFISSHWAFNMVVEQSLQDVDPKVSLPYWDFMIESGTLGSKWWTSDIFSPEMMGSAMGRSEDGFRLDTSSRFAGIRNIYDPDGTTYVEKAYGVARDAYGRINSPTNNHDEEYVTRSHSFCGMPGNVALASCKDFIGCFDDSDSLYQWEVCMERRVHANMHGWLGGAWNCAEDVSAWMKEHTKYSSQLLTFALNYVTANRWPSNSYFSSYNECPPENSCEPGVTPESACSCSCTLNVDDMPDSEIYELMEELMLTMSRSYGGADFVLVEDDDAQHVPADALTASADRRHRNYRFKQGQYVLSPDETATLLRLLAKIGCSPGYTGAMSTGASPSDPIFWLLHPIYDKALHALTLSGNFEHIDLMWHDLSCPGSKATDELPFSMRDLGLGSGKSLLTNSEIFQMAAGEGARLLPYMYDNFDKWGTCTWDVSTGIAEK